MKLRHLIILPLSFASFAFAQTTEQPQYNYSIIRTTTDPNWVDQAHATASGEVQDAANEINRWFGGSPDKPARAKIRIMLDNKWNRYDGYSFSPRIRGSIRLPALKDRLNLVFGDDSLDSSRQTPGDLSAENNLDQENSRTHQREQTQRDNSNIGLQWDAPTRDNGLQTNLRLGLRSGGDLYLRGKAEKFWDIDEENYLRAEQIYRYGLKSEHLARSTFEYRYAPEAEPTFISDQIHLEYANKANDHWKWGNSLYRQHTLGNDAWFNYGLYTGGAFRNNGIKLDTYGPFTGYRQALYKDWLFLQTELSYYNNKPINRNHHLGAMIRLEAQF